MPIPVNCPACSSRISAPDSAAGRKVKCPKCGSVLTIPAPASPAFEVVDDEPAEAAPQRPVKKAARVVTESNDADERPRRGNRRRDDDEDAPTRGRRKTAAGTSSNARVFIGVGVLVLLVAVAAGVWLSRSKPTDTAGTGGAGDGGTGPTGATDGGGVSVAENVKIISPRTRFKAEFAPPPKDKDDSQARLAREIRKVFLTPDGSRVVISNLSGESRTQVWDVAGEPKKRHDLKGLLRTVSRDGAVITTFESGDGATIDADTGKPTKREWTGAGEKFLRTDRADFHWDQNGDPKKVRPFQVHESERPSYKRVGSYPAGDDDRVALAPPVKGGRELVFGVPAANKVRVFDFTTKALTREFDLANPRPYRGPVSGQSYPKWSGFQVSEDGKWIAVKRVALGKEPDPIEIFDATGAAAATVTLRSASELTAAFLPNRDVYVIPIYDAKGSAFRAYDLLAFDINRKEFVAAFRGHEHYVRPIAFSADGKVMATGDISGEVILWDLGQLP